MSVDCFAGSVEAFFRVVKSKLSFHLESFWSQEDGSQGRAWNGQDVTLPNSTNMVEVLFESDRSIICNQCVCSGTLFAHELVLPARVRKSWEMIYIKYNKIKRATLIKQRHFHRLACCLVSLISFSASASTTSSVPAWQVKGIEKALLDPNPAVQVNAMRIEGAEGLIAFISDNEGQVLSLLVDRLQSDDPEVRDTASIALRALAAAGMQKMPQFIEILNHDNWRFRYSAVQALGGGGKRSFDQLVRLAELLEDREWRIRYAAVQALAKLGELPRKQMLKVGWRLEDEHPDVRRAVAQTLGQIGAPAASQVPMLAQRLRDDSGDVRAAAVEALGRIGKLPEGLVPQMAELLNDELFAVRFAAARALGALGARARDQSSHLAELLHDEEWRIRYAAAIALRDIAVVGSKVAAQLIERLGDDHPAVRGASAQALVAVDPTWRTVVDRLAGQLAHMESKIRLYAARAIGAFGARAKDVAPLVTSRLRDQNVAVRSAAARTLGAMGAEARDQATLLSELLDDDESTVRYAAVQSLGAIGTGAKDQVSLLVAKLDDEDWIVRYAAVQALETIGTPIKYHVLKIAERLGDEQSAVRSAAARALGTLGASVKSVAPRLADQLNDENSDVRSAAAQSLGAFGTAARKKATNLAHRLGDKDNFVRSTAARALMEMGPFEINFIPALLVHGYASRLLMPEMRFWSHFLTGGDKSKSTIVLDWLGDPHFDPMITVNGNLPHARKVLSLFAELWPYTLEYRLVYTDLAALIERLASNIAWSIDDVPLLEMHKNNLEAIGSGYAASIDRRISEIQGFNRLQWVLWIATLHGFYWIALIFAYPKFRPVQAIFFWNPWVRRVVGLGYVGFLLAWVPFLRKRLFAPFRDSLLADARLGEFPDTDYFPDSEVIEQSTKLRSSVVDALSKADGQIILQGESGLGKSMFLRHRVQNSKRLSVFLDAKRCDNGVLEAIQDKLEGQAKDLRYLRNVIFSGAIDVIIDGLNEVSTETRVRITQFAERFSKGNLIIATQPMQWSPPPLATVHVLQALRDDQIKAFLNSRAARQPEDAALRGSAFKERSEAFLRDSLDPETPQGEGYRRILSNPMDLEVVAQMLARGETPNLIQLQSQHYRFMAEDYKDHNQGHEFPLRRFADRVYEMRCEDETAFGAKEFRDELIAMAKHKMVIPRQMMAHEVAAMPQWTFRHDKIMDYFLVQAFLGPDNQRPDQHLGDARFRGTYLLMANLLPIDEAERLRERLIDHAADTKDHSISDSFIQRLRERKET